MKVGDYVRTDTGIITKIKNIIDFKKDNEFEYLNYNDVCVLTTESDYFHDVVGCRGKIIKSSPNIIDLIEVGDYINGVEVIRFEKDNDNKEYLQCGVGDYVVCTYYAESIHSIVTKKQFKSMEYKI